MPSNSLEQEAMERVARMYSSFDSRSRERVRRQPQPAARAAAEPPSAPGKPRQEQAVPEKLPPAEKAPKPHGLLELLMQDKEQSLILLLLVILMKDGADMNLMLALLYMLL